MIGTLPKTSLIIRGVERPVRMPTPEPLTIFPVYKLCLDVRPTMHSFLQCVLITKILIDVIPPYHVLSLYPPVKVIVNVTSIKVRLMYHRPVRAQPLFGGFGHLTDYLFHLSKWWVSGFRILSVKISIRLRNAPSTLARVSTGTVTPMGRTEPRTGT